MRLVEFALRGVRRFEAGRKLAFEEGYNLLSGPNESGKTTCLLAILATLEPEWLEGRREAVLPGPADGAQPGQARSGLVFLHEGRTYRLVRDLEEGAATLGLLDPASGKYQSLGLDAEGVRRWLRETAGLPGRRVFEALFWLDRAGMPSAAGEEARRAREAAPAAAGRGAAASGPALDGPARAARVAELRAELERVEEMSRVEFRLDGVKAKLFEVEAEFGDVRKLEQMAADLDESIGDFERAGVDPDHLEARARGFASLAEKRDADLAAVAAEREALELAAGEPVTAIWKDPLVLAGAGVTVVGLVGGLLFTNAVAALALVGLGLAGAGIARDAQAAARRKAARDGLASLEERAQTIEKKFDIETKAVRVAQEALGVSGPGGIVQRIEEYRALTARREAVADRREAMARQKNLAALDAERQRLAAEVAALEETLRGFGGTAAFDAGELRRELDVLEGRAAPEATASGDPEAGAYGLVEPGQGAGPAGPGATAAQVGAWLDAAARLLANGREAIARELLLRAQPTIGPLTADRHKSLAFDGDGRLVVVSTGGSTVALADVSPGTQDAVYLALRLAGHTMIARERPFPLLLDDPLGALDDARLQTACRALKAAARSGQILHTTVRRLPPALADSAQSLGA